MDKQQIKPPNLILKDQFKLIAKLNNEIEN